MSFSMRFFQCVVQINLIQCWLDEENNTDKIHKNTLITVPFHANNQIINNTSTGIILLWNSYPLPLRCHTSTDCP